MISFAALRDEPNPPRARIPERPKWSGKRLVPDPERAPLIARAFEELATGRFTKQEVIARMTEGGLRTRRGLVLSKPAIGHRGEPSVVAACRTGDLGPNPWIASDRVSPYTRSSSIERTILDLITTNGGINQ